ncbi:uncharacterized protein UTRI_00102_B [Ustilago trichophora]|uniref:Uncharacterized protein n=1 Tax=Ustilago trichophora TaxID=86804 RepID=A0A5C3DR82_9BASI|nr:uncharacterized protein UTRI_00102_B [Ustilago trichophora]
MFSVVLPGRLPLAEPQQVDETHCVFPLENASTISHVVVFMTGIQAFPPGYSATVHLNWPSSSAAAAASSSSSSSSGGGEWRLLGCLRNTKPSAIFKVTPPSSFSSSAAGGSATLGISIEPDHVVDAQLASLATTSPATSGSANFGLIGGPTPTTANSAESAALVVAPKIAKNAFSYLSSFAPDSAPQTVPLLQKWLEQLERKLRAQGVGWLDRQE